jgi:hypothetical protein
LLIECDHVIATIERAKERHLERPGATVADELGATDGLLPRLPLCIEPPVDHLDAAVVLQLIRSTDIAHATLERMIEPGDLVPLPEIAIYLKRIDRPHTVRRHRRAGEQRQGRHESKED